MKFTAQNAGRLSVAIYTTLSALVAGIFFALTVLTGDYSWVARVGGSGWLFLLSMIILMPSVTPWVRKRLAG